MTELERVRRYRKKPVVVEAMQYRDRNDVETLAMWGAPILETDALAWDYSAGAYLKPNGLFAHTGEGGMQPGCLLVMTLEGDMLARPNDWIIRGVAGEFYPCKPDIFELTYDQA